jgi:hypothetical protein
MAQGVFQTYGSVFQNANGTMVAVTEVYGAAAVVAVATPAAIATYGVVGNASITVTAAAETYGIPVFGTSLWVQRNWNTLQRLYKFVNWAIQPR